MGDVHKWCIGKVRPAHGTVVDLPKTHEQIGSCQKALNHGHGALMGQFSTQGKNATICRSKCRPACESKFKNKKMEV